MFTETNEGVILRLTIVPRASRNAVVGPYGDSLKIRLQAPPVDGNANQALLHFLAEALDVPRSRLELVSGHTGRQKRVLARGVTQQTAEQRFLHGLD